VLADANHQRAFVFSALLMFAGFTVIPYITIYMQANVGMRPDQIPVCLFVRRHWYAVDCPLFGRLTDRGKVVTFRCIGHCRRIAHAGNHTDAAGTRNDGVTVSTLFFMCMSGRMIPGMAIITSAANPALRGTFMTINAAVQSAAMGLAALTGAAHLISRDAQGLLQNYWMAAVVGDVQAAGRSRTRLQLHSMAAPVAPLSGHVPAAGEA
jgi:predicted MFS family arabinose efflux permease